MRWVAAVVAVVVAGVLVLAREQPEREAEVAPPSTTSTTAARPPADLWGLFDESDAYDRSILRALGTNEPTTRLRRVAPGTGGFGALRLQRSAEPFAGGTVRFEVEVRTVDAGAVGLYLRAWVNDATRFEQVADAGSTDRLAGTHDEVRLALDLAVPADATHIELGVVLEGGGEVTVGDWSLSAA